ncbi:MAG: PDZ domain-containing protein [Armatimonadota bacterium]
MQSKKSIIVFLLLFLIVNIAFCSDMSQDISNAINSVKPALVRIHVVSVDYSQGREMRSESFGSGVIISEDGYVVTNHHVAADALRLVCTLANKKEVDAKLIGTDPMSDIAVIKLSDAYKPYSFAKWGDSSKLSVGERIFAMGSPYALSQSVTMGIVSNNEMIMPDFFGSSLLLEGEDVGSIVRWIGHDALIRGGNSGGPLVNSNGEIVGINEISMGLSGAIPSNLAKYISEQLINNGKVLRSWVGINAQPLLKSSNIKEGVLVGSIMTDSPAEKADVKPGDIILKVNNVPVKANFKEEIPLFNQLIAELPIGEEIEFVINRGGNEITTKIKTQERAKAVDKQDEIKNWGITASNITYFMQKEMQLDSQDGVIVKGVLPSGPAGTAKPSLRNNDVIVKVNNSDIKDIISIKEITNEIIKDKKEQFPVVVEYKRGNKLFATVVKIGYVEPAKSGVGLRKAWLPIDTQVLTKDLAESLKVAGKTGVRVTQVYKNHSAEKAGINVGDLIVALDGNPIPASQIGDEEVLSNLIRQYDSGTEVELLVIRNGEEQKINVKLETSPMPTRDYPKYENKSFDLIARDISFQDVADGSIKSDENGVYIESVAEGSWSALAGLRSQDVVLELNGNKIKNLDDFKKHLSEIEENKTEVVLFKIQRSIHTKFIEIQPDWNDIK